MGVTYEQLMAMERVNVLEWFPGTAAGTGDRFPMAEAKIRAGEIARAHRGERAMLLGRAVAAAFGVRADYLQARAHDVFEEVVVVPHPSGLNRWWNDPNNERMARRKLKALHRLWATAPKAGGSSTTR